MIEELLAAERSPYWIESATMELRYLQPRAGYVRSDPMPFRLQQKFVKQEVGTDGNFTGHKEVEWRDVPVIMEHPLGAVMQTGASTDWRVTVAGGQK